MGGVNSSTMQEKKAARFSEVPSQSNLDLLLFSDLRFEDGASFNHFVRSYFIRFDNSSSK